MAIATNIVALDLRRIDSSVVRRAAAVMKGGGVLLYHTDTVYGLGCSAYSDRAVRRIYAIKRRPTNNPAILLVDSRDMLRRLVGEVSPLARALMREFWPGPLTIVFRARRRLHPFLVGPDRTVALRIPGNRFCLKLIRESGLPLVSTSANLSGSPLPEEQKDLIRLFRASADLLIDAGELPRMLPSTVVDLTTEIPVLLREGAVSRKALAPFLRQHA